jgi:hypothetical protein
LMKAPIPPEAMPLAQMVGQGVEQQQRCPTPALAQESAQGLGGEPAKIPIGRQEQRQGTLVVEYQEVQQSAVLV